MGKRLLLVAAVVGVLAAMTGGMAVAKTSKGPTRPSHGHRLHIVLPAEGAHIVFYDFDHNGLGFGDRLDSVGPILDGNQVHRLGTSYADCFIADRILVDGSIYDCTYVLKLGDGTITTQGLDPHGPSDVLFAINGGTGAYAESSGQAEYIDTDVTDIYLDFDEGPRR